jgi:hypothetical protein
MNILTKSIITLAAFAVTGLHADTIPVLKDTFGSTVTNKIAKASGKSPTLTVNGKSAAFIDFGVKATGYTAAQISGARITIFFPKVTTPGNLSLSLATSAFQENPSTSSIALPTTGAQFAQIPITTASTKNFVTIDVTDEIKSILNATNEFGFTIKSDGTANCTIGSKEGSATGYPAVLELDVNAGAGAVSGNSGTFTNFTTSNATINGPLTGGAATFSGDVVGAGGTFSGLTLTGPLNGTTASFSGSVSGAAGTFSGLTLSGALTGTTGSFSGNVSGAGGTFTGMNLTGPLVGTTGSFTGNVSGAGGTFSSLTLSGPLIGTTGNFSGNVAGATGNFSGDVSGAGGTFSSLTLSGALNGTAGNFTSLTVRDPGAQTGTIQVGGIEGNGDPKFIKFGDGDFVRIGENGADDTMQFDAARYLFNTGNVGIGTAPSSFKLDVGGSLNTGALTGTTGTFSGNVLFNSSVGIGALDPGAAVFNIFSATNNRRMKVETGSNTQFAGYDAKTPSSSWYMGTDTAPSPNWVLFDNNASANRIIVNNLGNIGIGVAPAGATPLLLGVLNPAKLTVGGNVNVTGTVVANNSVLSSDARFKKDITSITLGLDTVKKLRPVTYDWRRDEFPDRKFDAGNHSGFIAQEIGQVLPNVVTEIGGGYKAVNYVEVIPVLTRAIQELAEAKDAEIAALKEKLAASEARRTALDAEIQARLAKLEAASSTPAPAATTVSASAQ